MLDRNNLIKLNWIILLKIYYCSTLDIFTVDFTINMCSTQEKLNPCPICLEEIDDKGCATMLCGHQFHYNCIFKWNFTQKGDTCPICRDDLRLPQDVDKSPPEHPQPQSDAREVINIASTNGIINLEQRKKMITKIVDVTTKQSMGISVSCNSCQKTIHNCDFCNRPFCGCCDTNGLAHFPKNPFNKFYNTVFDHRERDEEMINIVGIENPHDEDLLAPRVCGCCFNNRDIVLRQTMEAISEGEFTEDIFDKSELKVLYYSLYYDNSGRENNGLRRLMPSYDSYLDFKAFIMHRYGIRARPVPRPRPRRHHYRDSIEISPHLEQGVYTDEMFEQFV